MIASRSARSVATSAVDEVAEDATFFYSIQVRYKHVVRMIATMQDVYTSYVGAWTGEERLGVCVPGQQAHKLRDGDSEDIVIDHPIHDRGGEM